LLATRVRDAAVEAGRELDECRIGRAAQRGELFVGRLPLARLEREARQVVARELALSVVGKGPALTTSCGIGRRSGRR